MCHIFCSLANQTLYRTTRKFLPFSCVKKWYLPIMQQFFFLKSVNHAIVTQKYCDTSHVHRNTHYYNSKYQHMHTFLGNHLIDDPIFSIDILFCSYRMPDWAEMASSLNQLSDSEVLLQCSTSPAAEPPHFVENERRFVPIFFYKLNLSS